jgi:DNA 3'-phosphatase
MKNILSLPAGIAMTVLSPRLAPMPLSPVVAIAPALEVSQPGVVEPALQATEMVVMAAPSPDLVSEIKPASALNLEHAVELEVSGLELFDGGELDKKKADAAPVPQYTVSRRVFLSDSFNRSGKVKVAFFDADDTLRRSKSGKFVVNEPDDVEILANVGEKIKALNTEGLLVVIVSNQAGIPRHVSLENADRTLLKTIELIGAQGGVIHYYDFAENKDDQRKPQTGMAKTLEAALKTRFGAEIDWKNSFMVGDAAYAKDEKRPDGTPGSNFSNSDRKFAENLGIPFVEAKEFFEREK